MTRACQISKCTMNGMLSTSPVCTNSTTGLTTYCCCYGDGCNTDPREITNPRSKEKNLVGRVAQRIEIFYDRDAVSSERNFIRRVVKHVYEHIDEGANDQLLPRWMQIP
ncbi:hypothetical protein AAVH_38717 [Aphelenchoides avenae]|nr:hypothetical protein AAVH_38717 [Aphelenchus avenae]